MRRTLIQEIGEIPYPQEHVEDLKRISPLMIESMERDGLPIESGAIKLGHLDKELDVALFLFRWVAENNSVIENLNLVLNDLRDLPTDYVLLKGSPKTRYYLLVRTYFNEFYRFREIHSRTVKAAADRGYISTSELPSARKAFHEAFEGTIALRNILVHGSPTWKGKQHFDLNLLVGAWEKGFALKSLETGEIWEIRDVLKEICADTADELREEGNRMSSLLNSLLRMYVDLVAKV
jgi:hypothetical protein